ncbi:hypothetical protein SLEP1_g22203 [Rubroshorea leprosula]|uniref:Uncharacterized protein n=1 Tax=Rubroshorea leprosula TaxID=152421 RepID=A0AAV5J8G3_9ROSI|nr:hypothetical protein SLEP1_g22203 [Rubroshorea leprosula]
MVGGQFWLVQPDDGVRKGGFREEADRERRKRFMSSGSLGGVGDEENLSFCC